jgi:RNA polymerase sigma-70 factor (ECF subfamily)
VGESTSREVIIDAVEAPVIPATADGFADWVSPHLAVLAALAERQVGAAAGADVVQEALLRAWRRRETFRPDRGTPRSWLVAILLDQARRHRTRWRWTSSTSQPPASGLAGPSGDRVDLERAIARLSKRQREVVTLHYLADLAVTEVAAVLGISESSVKAHLSAARAGLKTLLEES